MDVPTVPVIQDRVWVDLAVAFYMLCIIILQLALSSRGPDTLKFQSHAEWRASQPSKFRLTFSDPSDKIARLAPRPWVSMTLISSTTNLLPPAS
jgi:hypothetical protein